MEIYGSELFKGAAPYYSKYRPMYPASLVRYLVNRFLSDGNQQLLDLGCGTGQLTLRFADWCSQIVGIDVEGEMIQEAERLHRMMRIGDIHWFNGSLPEYKNTYSCHEKFGLVTIAKAFHWMDRQQVLEDLYDMVSIGGSVAIIDNYDPDKQETVWQTELNKVIKEWYGEERRAGKTVYKHPVVSHEQMLTNSRFDLDIVELPEYEVHWTIESIIGNLYSTSYGSRRFLGDRAEAFEHAVNETLLAVDSSGVYPEKMNLTIKLGLKNADN
ncbi:class I SAM-dependent methyltransferase [Sediminibacillus massiliensis]|uniref:class I SAM-dependent methyltransferase n=1 Tax=Sediminibacillus massiliensis TaxID=1926277 RepID=UPI000BAE5429|nr:class I SAM-dependent methyltransferase [Sediminibacillus massiliensis]